MIGSKLNSCCRRTPNAIETTCQRSTWKINCPARCSDLLAARSLPSRNDGAESRGRIRLINSLQYKTVEEHQLQNQCGHPPFHFLVTRLALPLIQVNVPSTLAHCNPPSILHADQESLHTLPRQIHPNAENRLYSSRPCHILHFFTRCISPIRSLPPNDLITRLHHRWHGLVRSSTR